MLNSTFVLRTSESAAKLGTSLVEASTKAYTKIDEMVNGNVTAYVEKIKRSFSSISLGTSKSE
jgi:hypothetical protein